jgi:hypothetical protein
LPEIRELQRGANMVGQCRPPGIVRLAEIQHQSADRIGRISAVVQQLIVAVISLDPLVLLEGTQQIKERLRWDGEPPNGRHQRDHHRMRGLPIVAAEEFSPPPGEQTERFFTSGRLVGEVVGPAAISVNGMEVPEQPAWQ